MSRLRRVMATVAAYRPDPTRSDGIVLAVVAGFNVGNQAAVSIAAAAELSPQSLEKMDGIARELLAPPIEYFKTCLEEHVRSGTSPDMILRALSETNNTAICVFEPQELTVDIRLDEGANIADVASHVAMHMFSAAERGENPFDLRITGHSGRLAQAASALAPHVAHWANAQAAQRPEHAQLRAR